MTLKEVMSRKRFAIVGDTLNPEKYACRIKNAMLAAGYTVHAVGKELASLNDIPGDVDIIDLCIHPAKGLKLMRECEKSFECIVIQPGAGSDELKAYLEENNMPYIENCLLIGLKEYPGAARG